MSTPAQEPTGKARLTQALVDMTDVLVGDFDVVELLTSVADRCVDVLDASAAQVMLVAPGGDVRVIARSGEATPALELLGLQTGQGPGPDCIRTGRPVVNEDLAEADGRWPRFAPAALDAGFHSAHAVPLRLRGTTFGALSFMRIDRAALGGWDIVAAQALADVAVLAILQHSVALEDVHQQLNDALDSQVLIEQATNMVAERAGLEVEPAFQRLRNHARSSRFRLVDVAVDVMAGGLPSIADAPLVRRRASDAPLALTGSSPDVRLATRSTLSVLSRAVEQVAAAAGPDATVLALFQRGAYVREVVDAYTSLASSCSAVVTAFAGDGPDLPGAIHVRLDDDEDLTRIWGVVVLTPSAAAYVVGRDREVLDPAGHSLEDRRQFEASWGFDRDGACAQARWLLDELGVRLSPDARQALSDAITLAEATPTPRAEEALSRTALVLAERLDDTHRRLLDAVAGADLVTPSARRDPVTGVLNADGLVRWLGGSTLDGVPMPSIGVVVIDLPGIDAIVEHDGQAVADRLLVAVARALLAVTRLGDVVVRWEPTRFLVLCAGLDGSELAQVCERLLAAASATTIDGLTIVASGHAQTCTHRPLRLVPAAHSSERNSTGQAST